MMERQLELRREETVFIHTSDTSLVIVVVHSDVGVGC